MWYILTCFQDKRPPPIGRRGGSTLRRHHDQDARPPTPKKKEGPPRATVRGPHNPPPQQWKNAMQLSPAELSAPKPRKRPAPKPSGRQNSGRVKSTVHLSTEAHQRLAVHAAMSGMDRSAM